MIACGTCGHTLLHVVDERGDRYVHTVEPIGHEARPSDDAARGRARAMRDLGGQLALSIDKGKPIDADWVRNWIEWWGDDSLLPTTEQENAAYREAMAAVRRPKEVVPDPA